MGNKQGDAFEEILKIVRRSTPSVLLVASGLRWPCFSMFPPTIKFRLRIALCQWSRDCRAHWREEEAAWNTTTQSPKAFPWGLLRSRAWALPGARPSFGSDRPSHHAVRIFLACSALIHSTRSSDHFYTFGTKCYQESCPHSFHKHP